ncbi:hypothetical protein D9M70_403700 [compost metagenome]
MGSCCCSHGAGFRHLELSEQFRCVLYNLAFRIDDHRIIHEVVVARHCLVLGINYVTADVFPPLDGLAREFITVLASFQPPFFQDRVVFALKPDVLSSCFELTEFGATLSDDLTALFRQDTHLVTD